MDSLRNPGDVRILFLSQYFAPEPGAPAARTYEHARLWAEAGHDVTVVCGFPNHPTGIVPPRYRRRPLAREVLDKIRVLRCWLFATPNRGVFKRSISFITFMASSMVCGALATPPCDVVVATSPQILCGLSGLAVARVKRRPFVLEVRDLWPQQIVDLGVVRNRFIVGLLSRVESLLYRQAAAIVTVAPATKEAIAARGFPAEKIYTVSNGIDESFFYPRDRHTPPRQRYGWGEDIVVMYIGTHGLSQGLATLLDTARLLSDRKSIRFVFVGTGAERELLKKKAQDMGLANIQFLPMQPKEEMPNFYNAADICLVPLKKRDVFLYNIPSKMFEIMACGRPIVLGVGGQAKRVLDEAEAGMAVEPENAQAYAHAIEQLADNPELRETYGRNGREHVVQYYSRAVKAEEFVLCLEETLAREGVAAKA